MNILFLSLLIAITVVVIPSVFAEPKKSLLRSIPIGIIQNTSIKELKNHIRGITEFQ